MHNYHMHVPQELQKAALHKKYLPLFCNRRLESIAVDNRKP